MLIDCCKVTKFYHWLLLSLRSPLFVFFFPTSAGCRYGLVRVLADRKLAISNIIFSTISYITFDPACLHKASRQRMIAVDH
jgi:hypothetical protein